MREGTQKSLSLPYNRINNGLTLWCSAPRVRTQPLCSNRPYKGLDIDSTQMTSGGQTQDGQESLSKINN